MRSTTREESEQNKLGWIVGVILIASILFVGYVNGQDLKECEKKHSRETCLAIINP